MPKTEYCCGIIPLQKRGGEWWLLLIQHLHGKHWSFPKGHLEGNETPWQAAERELLEETGLHTTRLLFETPLRESYFIAPRNSLKTVDYFLAEVEGEVVLQKAEISAFCWQPLQQAASLITFPEARRLLAGVCDLLEKGPKGQGT